MEDLLREEDIVQEMRNQNEKLLKFFKRDQMKGLIDLVTNVPAVDEHELAHKFPFVANELLTLDIEKLNSKFFNVEVIEEEDDDP